MKQSFVEMIRGHEVEFNRLLYPVHYKVIVRVDNENPVTLTVNKVNDQWAILKKENCEDWVKQKEQDILNAVNENEINL